MVNVTLGVAIGVVFVFLLFSLFLSTALEAVSSLMKLRGRALRVAIAGLIGDPAHLPRRGGFGLVDALWPQHVPAAGRVDAVDPETPELHEAPTEGPGGDCAPYRGLSFGEVFGHPLVAGNTKSGKPSYVPSRNFASAILYVLAADAAGSPFDGAASGIAALPPGSLRTALQTALQEAHGDWNELRSGVEQWYEHAMDRLSGEYKRFSQLAMFLAGLLLAVAYDVDAIAIAQRLYVDDDLRTTLTQQATDYVTKAAGTSPSASGAAANPLRAAAKAQAPASAASASAPDSDAEDFRRALTAAKTARTELTKVIALVGDRGETPLCGYVAEHPGAILGWLITALAGMLGAPFWFQVLQKLVNLRGAGPKPTALSSSTAETAS